MRSKYAKISDPNSFFTCPGERFHIIYKAKLDAAGEVNLVEVDRVDIQEQINSQRDCTDMAYILRRLGIGDSSVLNVSSGVYGDYTDCPKTMAEALQLSIDAEKAFLRLPLDTRNQFSNDFKKWFASAGSDAWMRVMYPDLFVKKEADLPSVEKESIVKDVPSVDVKE